MTQNRYGVIKRATVEDGKVIAEIGIETFLDAHGSTLLKESSDQYVAEKFSAHAIREELSDNNNIFHLILLNDKPVGYSKIIFNCASEFVSAQNITKMERLYILKECYGKRIGQQLFDFNQKLCVENNQKLIWLTVWAYNHRAIGFYERLGFEYVGEIMFKVADSFRPNHVMCLSLENAANILSD